MVNNNSKTLTVKEFKLGSVIVMEGASSPKEMIVVLQGNVGIYKNYKMTNETFIKSIGRGSIHCELSLFLNREQEETLVALSDVLVFTINRDNIKEFITKNTDVAISMMETICKKLSDANTALDKLQPKTGSDSGLSKKSALFPEGHGSYTLPLTNNCEELIIYKSTCPLCGRSFDSLWILMSKLKRDITDPDSRTRFKNLEPLYYEIITCPNCLFSAESASFASAPKKYADAVSQKVSPYRLDIRVQTGKERDTFTVFTGYYLALLCAPVALDNHELVTAGLWHKISRLYQDCEDTGMQMFAVKKALESYNYVYSNVRINEKQTQQVRYVIGELYYKLDDYDAARNFFFMLKTDNDAPSLLKRQVEKRLDEIREIKRAEQEANK